MYFAPYVVRGRDAEKVAVEIIPAAQQDIAVTKGEPAWQTVWDSEYLSSPTVDKFAMKLKNGELLALGAYQISGRKAYVYILYLESAHPATRRSLNLKAENTTELAKL